MGNVADGPRTGYGLNKLRDRHIRRGEYLVSDNQFINRMNELWFLWNQEHPRYPLGEGALSTSGDALHAPQSLEDDLERHDEEYAALENGHSEQAAFIRDRQRLYQRFVRTMAAERDWAQSVMALTSEYFPATDFYNPMDPDEASALFIATCLKTDPRLIGDCADYFPPFRVRVARVDGIDDPNIDLYLPLYPGMTPQDLTDGAADIVGTVNHHYADRTPTARAIALRAEGMTHREIADRLGLTVQTVAATLKGAIGTTETG